MSRSCLIVEYPNNNPIAVTRPIAWEEAVERYKKEGGNEQTMLDCMNGTTLFLGELDLPILIVGAKLDTPDINEEGRLYQGKLYPADTDLTNVPKEEPKYNPKYNPTIWKCSTAKAVGPDHLGSSLVGFCLFRGWIDLAKHIRPWPDLVVPILVSDVKALPKILRLLNMSRDYNSDQFARAFKNKDPEQVLADIQTSLLNGQKVLLDTMGKYEEHSTPESLGKSIQKLL